eukprot:888698_1
MSPPLKCTNVWCLSLFLSIVLVGSNLSNIRVGWDPFSDNTHLRILHPRRITTVDWVSTRFQPLSQYRDHAPFFTNRIAENASRKTIFLTFNRIVTRFVRTITIDWPSLISLNTISSIAQFKIEYCDCREEETACLHVEHSTTNILTTIRAKVNEAVRGRNGAFFALSTLFFIALHLLTHMGNTKWFILFILLHFGSAQADQSTYITSTFCHNCILHDNRIKCWGSNAWGDLGYEDGLYRGKPADLMGDNLPVVDLGPNFKPMQVSLGQEYSCALSTDNRIKTWGRNYEGKLGYGDEISRGNTGNTMGEYLPDVDLGPDFVPIKVVAGDVSTCALSKSNTAKCWGSNGQAQLGAGDMSIRGDAPGEMGTNLSEIDLGLNFQVIDIGIGKFHACALSTNKTIKCWGYNAQAQLGLGIAYPQAVKIGDEPGEMGDHLSIVDLGSMFIPMAIAVGGYHACVLSTTNKVKCFGYNLYGQLADGTYTNKGWSSSDMGDNLAEIDFGTNFIPAQLAAGRYHSCALSTINTVKCWGSGDDGQLGYEDNITRNYANGTEVVELGPGFIPVQIEAGWFHTIALSINGTVKAWGKNNYGQCGITGTRGDDPGEMGANLPMIPLGSFPTWNPSMSPTHPSNNPTMLPTTRYPTSNPSYPTSVPTKDPSRHPTFNPTKDPTIAPTVCIDIAHNVRTHDGSNEMQFDWNILNISDYLHNGTDTDYFNTTVKDDEDIKCNSVHCLIECNDVASCLSKNITATNANSGTMAVFCYEKYSCLSAIVSPSIASAITIICIGRNSCTGMQIDVSYFKSFNLYCANRAACNDMEVDILLDKTDTSRDNDGIIQCIIENSCDNLQIATSSQKTQLLMYQYSDNVVLDNNIGYLSAQNNIDCNMDRYIKFQGDSNETIQSVTTSILNEYNDGLPCSDVHVLCGNTSCEMTYSAINPIQLESLNEELTYNGCYWLHMEIIQHVFCEGECEQSPTESPTKSPTSAPTHPTLAPSINPTKNPSMNPTLSPSNAPTNAPSMAPSIHPTLAPSNSPSLHPSNTPTTPPTNSPSYTPTTAPSFSPLADPTRYPTVEPTTDPTIAPSFSPTVSPSHSPSLSPSNAPTMNPSVAPSLTPTNVPSNPPSNAPTRVPTRDMNKIYDRYIPITYIIKQLSEANTKQLEQYPFVYVPRITEIIERHYLSDIVKYEHFFVQIIKINGFTDFSASSDLALKDGQSVILQSQILATHVVADLLAEISQGMHNDFAADVTVELKKEVFTDNGALQFEVSKLKTLTVQSREECLNDTSSSSIVFLTVVLTGLGGVFSLFVLYLNHRSTSKFDNQMWTAPFFFVLQAYDFVSDLFLCSEIFGNCFYAFGNTIFWCGVSAVVFTVIPFLINLLYGVKIKRQEIIALNKRADEYFSARMTLLIGLIIISGGCFPGLMLTSSGIFGLNLLDNGLTKYELDQLIEIKIKSTILLENGPQLIIQVVYAWATLTATNSDTATLPDAVVLAFIGSSLSVLMAVARWYAHRHGTAANVVSYYLRFEATSQTAIAADQKGKIEAKKRKKKKLTESIANALAISQEAIQIGYVWTIPDGCEMRIVHFVSKTDLAKHRRKHRGRISEITPNQYLRQLYTKREEDMNGVFRNHFDISDPQFMVRFVMTDNDMFTPIDSDDVDDDEFKSDAENTYAAVTRSMPNKQLVEMQQMMVSIQDFMKVQPSERTVEMNDVSELKQKVDVMQRQMNETKNETTAMLQAILSKLDKQ